MAAAIGATLGFTACQEPTPPPAAPKVLAPAEEVPTLEGQSRANGVRVYAPDGTLAFTLIPWEDDWTLVSPSGHMTGRVRGFGDATQVLDASGKDLAATVRAFSGGFEVVDDKQTLLATVRTTSGITRVLGPDGTLLLEQSPGGLRNGNGTYKSPLRVDGDTFPLAAAVLSLSKVSFAGRVALLFALSTPV